MKRKMSGPIQLDPEPGKYECENTLSEVTEKYDLREKEQAQSRAIDLTLRKGKSRPT